MLYFKFWPMSVHVFTKSHSEDIQLVDTWHAKPQSCTAKYPTNKQLWSFSDGHLQLPLHPWPHTEPLWRSWDTRSCSGAPCRLWRPGYDPAADRWLCHHSESHCCLPLCSRLKKRRVRVQYLYFYLIIQNCNCTRKKRFVGPPSPSSLKSSSVPNLRMSSSSCLDIEPVFDPNPGRTTKWVNIIFFLATLRKRESWG